MDREKYLEMCKMLGTDPSENEIPREYDDFTYQGQLAIDIANMLPDRIDGASGMHLGKDMSVISTLFDVFDVEKDEQLLIYGLVNTISNEVATQFNTKSNKIKTQQENKVDA